MQRLTITHVRRWQQNRGHAGLVHVYQGRSKWFLSRAMSIVGWRRFSKAQRVACESCLASGRMAVVEFVAGGSSAGSWGFEQKGAKIRGRKLVREGRFERVAGQSTI